MRNSRIIIPTLDRLQPSKPEQLRDVAYQSMCGDIVSHSIGIHSGDPGRKDSNGWTKAMVENAALDHNLGFFQKMIDQFNDHGSFLFSPALRFWISKGNGKFRPIDDPSELCRLYTLFVRDQIEPALEDFMTDGQYGGRTKRSLSRNKNAFACSGRSPTFTDHIVFRMHRHLYDREKDGRIHKAMPFVLSIDLSNAFGELPKDSVQYSLEEIGFSDDVIDYIWDLVRINAVSSETGRRIYVEDKNKGIGQGNPLSAMMMNVCLAPLVRKLESKLGVKAFVFVDDLYIMGESHNQMRDAYFLFRAMARGLGFSNVRPLGDGDKESRITDVRKYPVIVLNTNTISMDMIGLADLPSRGSKSKKGKLTELRENIAKLKQYPQIRITPNLIRELAGSEAITKRWMKTMGLL